MSVRVEQLTAEQRRVLLPRSDLRDLVITGEAATGRTTALLHALMHTMSEHRMEAKKVVFLVPDQAEWAQAQRTLEAYRPLLGVQVMTPVRLAQRLGADWENRWLPGNKESSLCSKAAKRRAVLVSKEWSTGGQVHEERSWREEVEAHVSYAFTGAGTDLEKLLSFADRFADLKKGQESRKDLRHMFWTIVVDDFERFSPADLLFITVLRGQYPAAPGVTERRPRVMLTTRAGPRYQAWKDPRPWPHLSAVMAKAAEVALSARMNRREVLALLEGLAQAAPVRRGAAPVAVSLIPARGFGGSVEVRQCEARAGAEVRGRFLEPVFNVGVLEDFRGHVRTALNKARREGRDLAVVSQGGLQATLEQELETLWQLERVPKTNDAPPALLAALRCKVGLPRPSGGHPLYAYGTFPERRFSSEERVKADAAWIKMTPLPTGAAFHEMERDILRANTTDDLCRLAKVQWPEPLPQEPLRALETLLARRAEPRYQIHLAGLPTRSWSSVVYVCRPQVDRTELQAVIERTLDHLTIVTMPPEGLARRFVGNQEVDVMTFLKQYGKDAWPVGLLTGRDPMNRALLQSLLDAPVTKAYLTRHAPRHVGETTLAAWIKALGEEGIPTEWRELREPARPWHGRVTLVEEQERLRGRIGEGSN